MIKLPNKLQNYLKNDNISIVPILVIGKSKFSENGANQGFRNWEQGAIFLSIKKMVLNVVDGNNPENSYEITTLPLLEDFPEINDNIDYFGRSSSVSSFSTRGKNIPYPTEQGKILSDRFSDLSHHIINSEVRLYYATPLSTTLIPEFDYVNTDPLENSGIPYYEFSEHCDCALVYSGNIRDAKIFSDFVEIDVEDKFSLINKDIPDINYVLTKDHFVAQKDVGRIIPIHYGSVKKAPIVYTSSPLDEIDYSAGVDGNLVAQPTLYIDSRKLFKIRYELENHGYFSSINAGLYAFANGEYLPVDKVTPDAVRDQMASAFIEQVENNYSVDPLNNKIVINTLAGGGSAGIGLLTTTFVRYPARVEFSHKGNPEAGWGMSYDNNEGYSWDYISDESLWTSDMGKPLMDKNVESYVELRGEQNFDEERYFWFRLFFDPIATDIECITYYRIQAYNFHKPWWNVCIGDKTYEDYFKYRYPDQSTETSSFGGIRSNSMQTGDHNWWLQVGYPETLYSENYIGGLGSPPEDFNEEVEPNKNRGWDKLNSFDVVSIGSPQHKVSGEDESMEDSIKGSTSGDLFFKCRFHEMNMVQYGLIKEFSKYDFYVDVLGRVFEQEMRETIGSFGGSVYPNDQGSGMGQMITGMMIDNPIFVALDILISELGIKDFDREGMRYALWTQYEEGVPTSYPKTAFSIDEQVNAHKLIFDVSSTTNVIPKMRNDGRFSFIPLKFSYNPTTDPFIEVGDGDILDFRAEMTPRENIITKCFIKYDYDYANDSFSEVTDPAVAQEQVFLGYTNDFYGLAEDHSESTKIIENKFIRDSATAIRLRDFIISNYCNSRLVVKMTLTINHLQLETGDLIGFSENVNGKKLFGENYSLKDFNIADAYKRNGQIAYPLFMITNISKGREGVSVEAIQMMHTGLTGEAVWEDENEWGELIINGCTDFGAENFNPFASNNDGSCVYGDTGGPDLQITTHQNPLTYLNTDSNSLDFNNQPVNYIAYAGKDQMVNFGNWSVDTSDIATFTSLLGQGAADGIPVDAIGRWEFFNNSLMTMINQLGLNDISSLDTKTGRMHFEWFFKRISIIDPDGNEHTSTVPNGWGGENVEYNMDLDPFKEYVKFGESSNILRGVPFYANPIDFEYEGEVYEDSIIYPYSFNPEHLTLFPYAGYENISEGHNSTIGYFPFRWNNLPNNSALTGHASQIVNNAESGVTSAYPQHFGLDFRDYSWEPTFLNSGANLWDWYQSFENNFLFWYHSNLDAFSSGPVVNYWSPRYDVSQMGWVGAKSLFAPPPGYSYKIRVKMVAHRNDFESDIVFPDWAGGVYDDSLGGSSGNVSLSIGEAYTEFVIENVTDGVELGTGDFNQDGVVNILDVVQMVNYVLGDGEEPDQNQILSGDMNGDGIINVLDVVSLVQEILDV